MKLKNWLQKLLSPKVEEQEKNNTQLLLETIEQYNETISLLNDCIKNQQQTINSPQQKEVIVENPVNKELEERILELLNEINDLKQENSLYKEKYNNVSNTIEVESLKMKYFQLLDFCFKNIDPFTNVDVLEAKHYWTNIVNKN